MNVNALALSEHDGEVWEEEKDYAEHGKWDMWNRETSSGSW